MLSADQISAYRRDGFVVARGVLTSGEIEALRGEEERLWSEAAKDLEREGVFWRKHETLGRVADRLDPVRTISTCFAAVAEDSRMMALASCVLGASSTFFKDKLITKPPGTHGYGLHYDYAYWKDLGVPPDEFVTLSLALDPSDEANGGVELFSGLQAKVLPPSREDPLDLDPASIDGLESRVPELAAGDVLVFHSRVPHRSAPNRSDRARRVYVATYMHARHAGRVHLDDAERRKIVYRALARENV
jgi:ectoine hydroxylase-related dioxygenase (phytanoyl-CoA dioxygenase family)